MCETELEIKERLLDAKIPALTESLLNPKGALGYYASAAIPITKSNKTAFSRKKPLTDSRYYRTANPELVIRAFKMSKAYRLLCAQSGDAFCRKFTEEIIKYSLDTHDIRQYLVAHAVQNAIRKNPDLIQPSSHLANLIGIFFETIKAILKCVVRFPIEVFLGYKYYSLLFYKSYIPYIDHYKTTNKKQVIFSAFLVMLGMCIWAMPFHILIPLTLTLLLLDIMTPLNALVSFLVLPLCLALAMCLTLLTAGLVLLEQVYYFLFCPKDIFILICGAIAVSVCTLIYACKDSVEACITLGQKAYSTTVDLGVSTVSTLFSSTAKKDNAESNSTDPAPGPSCS